MTRITKAKKAISILLLISILVPLLPIGELVAYADDPAVTSITVYRTYNDLTGIGEYGINIRGTGLSRLPVRYMVSGGSQYIPLTNPGPGSDDYFRQFTIPAGQVISNIMVGNQDFKIMETNMPRISSVDPKQVDLNLANPTVTIKGQNFMYFGPYDGANTTITIENKDVTNLFKNPSNQVILQEDDLKNIGYGNKNIVIERTKKEGNVDINVVYNYLNTFRVYESIDPNIDVNIYPNRGKIGSQTTITINGIRENFSVFFLENETDLFKYENLGENPEYQQTTENKSIIKVTIPKALTVGKTYKVVITNNLDNVKKAGLDLTNFVTKQKVIGEFYVVDASVGPTIFRLNPNQGTSAGSDLTIYGYRLEELKINELNVKDNSVTTNDLEIITGGADDPSILRITYKTDDMTYKGKTVVKATRDFLVTIGRDAQFIEGYKSRNIFRLGDDKEDELYVRTKTIDGADLQDPVKDVVVAITTTIETIDGEVFEFTELAILERGYRFLPSYQDPTITNITPNKIEVVSESNPVTKNTTVHSIEGQNFNVFRYSVGGEMKTNYPKVFIGGSGEDNAQIIIERDENGNINYYIREAGILKKADVDVDCFFEVLDANGNIVTGIGGNEVGRFITFTIPENLLVAANILNTALPIAVANPKRDSADRGIPIAKTDMIRFVTGTSSPTIESVNPNIVTVDGGVEIIVSGRGFLEGIEVYIDGRKVNNVTRDLDPITTRGILKFIAPKGREGINILQVMNPDGGSDTHPFVFVETLRIDPKITSITPPRGTEGDVIIIKGDNFLKPDPTVEDLRGMGMSKLIGTKVYLGAEEVNQYVEGGGLESYSAPEISDEPLLTVERNPWTNIDELILTPYYKEARIKDSSGKSYTITRDRDGHVVLIGEGHSYTFDNDYNVIRATDGSNIFELIQEDDKLILRSENIEHVFTVSYDFNLFSILENPYGVKELKVADYYDSIFLRDSNGNLYSINKDQLNRVTISDERENTYNIKIDGDRIVATRGSQSYPVTVEKDHIEIDGSRLDFVTPYYIDPTTKMITGHRVRVLSRNEIEIIIPEKQIAGFYDVKVENPDTKSHTIVRGFEYTKPQIRPVIYYIDPAEGSVDGGYYITIIGENFGDNPEVRIDGVLVAAKDTIVNKEDYKSIKVLVPKYTGNIDTDFITDKKYVRVHVTTGGASTSRNDLFAYKIASSKPRITKINPTKGPTSGGNVVEIIGTDFRFYEPYRGNPPKKGETNFEDIDGNGEWTNFNSDLDIPISATGPNRRIPLDDSTIKDYTHYIESPVLPSIYFGNNKAKIVEFERVPGTDTYRIMVLAPTNNTAGQVDVYLRNNDAGQSPSIKYTYEASKPNIVSINTNTGRRTGGEIKDIIATGYRGNQIRLIDEEGRELNTTMYLVRFGEISNRNITDTDDPNYGQIRAGKAAVEFRDSGLAAEINGAELTIIVKEGNKEYTGKYYLASGSKYINLKSLKAEDNTSYPGFELVKVERSEGRLLIDRGFAPEVKERVAGTLEVVTPSYHRATTVSVTIVNPDGISNKANFTYVNPGSRPTITNIIRDGKQPSIGDDGRTRIVQLRSKGSHQIRVIGADFRPNATIYIGSNFLQIKPDFISETELVFTMPEVKDESKFNTWHVLTVVNEDRGEARSDRSIPTPIYLVITESESEPEISSLEPNKGPVTGGTLVTIRGKDFRNIMEGYEGENITVIFGDKEISNVTYNNYGSITVTAPSYHKAGPVEVKVKNPDGTLSLGFTFNYISKPSIKSISPNKLFTNDTETIVTIKGSMFQDGIRVIVGAKLEDAKATDTVKYISGVKDGKNIEKVIVGGIETKLVEFVSEEEIKISFPEIVDLENTSIIIVNPDGGISDPYNQFRFETPIPTKPMILEAIAGYESTVQLIWSKSDENLLNRAEKYEIYGRKTSDKENSFIGTTSNAEFLVKGLEPDTQYSFMVRALNKYGASIDFATVTVKTLSLRQDDKLKEKEDKLKEEEKQLKEYGKEELVNGRYTITLGTRAFRSGTGTVDLTLSKYKNQNKITIAIPIELARKDNRLTIKDGTMTGVINIRDLYTLQVSRLDKGDENAYIRIHLDKSTATHLPIGTKAASKAYDLYFDYIYGKNSSLKINQLLRNGLLFMEQDTLTYPNTKNTKIYILNVETGEYEPINSTTTDIKGSMNFVLLSDR